MQKSIKWHTQKIFLRQGLTMQPRMYSNSWSSFLRKDGLGKHHCFFCSLTVLGLNPESGGCSTNKLHPQPRKHHFNFKILYAGIQSHLLVYGVHIYAWKYRTKSDCPIKELQIDLIVECNNHSQKESEFFLMFAFLT
jgi:hypothetical protein